MTASGHIIFSQMNEVVFGVPAAQAVAELARRMGAARVPDVEARLDGASNDPGRTLGGSHPVRPTSR